MQHTQRGGRRPGAGRKKGAVSAAKLQLAVMAKDHAEDALKTLADIARDGTSEAARVSAAMAILDRAYGKPPQSLDHTSFGESMAFRPTTIEFVAPIGLHDDEHDERAN